MRRATAASTAATTSASCLSVRLPRHVDNRPAVGRAQPTKLLERPRGMLTRDARVTPELSRRVILKPGLREVSRRRVAQWLRLFFGQRC